MFPRVRAAYKGMPGRGRRGNSRSSRSCGGIHKLDRWSDPVLIESFRFCQYELVEIVGYHIFLIHRSLMFESCVHGNNP